MRRLSYILVLAILVGGLSLGSTQASAAHSPTHSSVLLAQGAAQPAVGFFSGIASAFDKIVTSVIDAVKAAFGFRALTPKVDLPASVAVPSATSPTIVKPAGDASLAASMPAPILGVHPVPTPAPAAEAPAEGPLDPQLEPAMPGEIAAAEGPKASFSLFSNTSRSGATTVLSGAKVPVATASARPSAAKAVAAAQMAPVVAQSASGTTPSVATIPQSSATKSQPETVAPAASTVPTASEVQATAATPTERSVNTSGESRVAAAPLPTMLYAQQLISTTSRPATSEPATRPVAVRPVTRPPTTVVGYTRFIDDNPLIPAPQTRPVTEPAIRVVVEEEPVAVVTRSATLPTRIEEVRTPTDLFPNNATVEPPTESRDAGEETPVAAAPVGAMPRTIILNNGEQPVIIQTTATSATVIDPATFEAVVCKIEGDFPVLSLGEDDAGLTRGVVLAGGAILLKPADFFKKFLRLEGAPFAIDAPAKECSLLVLHSRLSTPDLVINMPKLSEADRELVSAKAAVVDGGRVFIVAADNSAEKTLRGIVVREADGRRLFKLLPERNQVAQTVRSMTVTGDLATRMVVDLVLNASDGTGTTQHCEFAKDANMTCTTRGAL